MFFFVRSPMVLTAFTLLYSSLSTSSPTHSFHTCYPPAHTTHIHMVLSPLLLLLFVLTCPSVYTSSLSSSLSLHVYIPLSLCSPFLHLALPYSPSSLIDSLHGSFYSLPHRVFLSLLVMQCFCFLPVFCHIRNVTRIFKCTTFTFKFCVFTLISQLFHSFIA